MPENAEKYLCEACDFKCSKQSNYKKHVMTLKHKVSAEGYKKDIKKCQKMPQQIDECFCECGKKYNYYSGLWRHRKKCKKNINASSGGGGGGETAAEETLMLDVLINDNKDFKQLILEMMKNNGDLQSKMLELCKNGGINNINGNTINSHNKTFNMQFFLNEQCKDAMNIKDFIDSFQLQFADLERVGELGYVDGISELIIKKLNEMDIYKRPIHCSDTKRDIMFVRAENVWEKETNGHERVRLLIRQVTHQNIKLIPLWAATYPQARDNEHPLNETYLGMVGQAMGGRGDLEESENKIIKKIAKTVYIDKYV